MRVIKVAIAGFVGGPRDGQSSSDSPGSLSTDPFAHVFEKNKAIRIAMLADWLSQLRL